MGSSVSNNPAGKKPIDWFTVAMIALGVALVLVLPLGTAMDLSISQSINNKLNGFIGVDGPRPYVETWELAASLWSLLYCFLFHLYKFPRAYADGPGRAGPISIVTQFFVIGTGGVTVGVYVLFATDAESGILRVTAEASIVAWLALIDLLLAYVLSSETIPKLNVVKDAVKEDYRKFFAVVDAPGLLAFGVILLFMWISTARGAASSVEFASFGAGAAAMNLLLVNIAFSVLFFREGGGQ
ncbi:MAG: hypothetical protein WEB04_02050 [Dehalococcoidia bacterium]